MEINGIANLHIIVDGLYDKLKEAGQDTKYSQDFIKIKEQLDLLERYMLAVKEAHDNMSQVPYWHDIKANKKVFPLNRERFSK